ncbi:DUF4259 domain-containing protein, partial [Streptomyces ureilyticus]|nr:DUF4259 domain-containing protein [Streptomyces ureilyticus]
MGTWGTGPFDSDLAADFVDELEGLTSQRAFMQVKPYMRLSFLPCFEGFHPLGGEWRSPGRRRGHPSRSL